MIRNNRRSRGILGSIHLPMVSLVATARVWGAASAASRPMGTKAGTATHSRAVATTSRQHIHPVGRSILAARLLSGLTKLTRLSPRGRLMARLLGRVSTANSAQPMLQLLLWSDRALAKSAITAQLLGGHCHTCQSPMSF